MDGNPWANFLIWERASRDTIDFKTIYVDMADDLISGLLLSQIVYWYLPSKKGGSKLRVFKDGYYWIAKARHEWWDEIRVKTRQIDRAIEILEKKGIIFSHLYRFNNAPTTHIRIIKEGFLAAWDNALARFDETVKSEMPSDPFSPNRQFDFTDPSSGFDETVKSDLPESVQSLTETTIDSTETTAENAGDFPENSKTLTSKQMIQTTADLFDEVGPETPEEIDAELREAGYDPGEVGARMKAVADQAIIDQIIKQAETRPDLFDLSFETAAAREKALGNYATPVHAGGADLAAETALSALYTARGSEPPLPDSNTYKLELEKVSQVLSDNGVTDPDISRLAAQMMCKANEKSPKFVNPHFRSFPSSFTYHLGVAKGQVNALSYRRDRDRELTEDSLAILADRRAAQPQLPEDDAVGQGIKAQLEQQVSRHTFQLYVVPSSFACDNGALVITALDDFGRDWLKSRLAQTIERALVSVADGPGEVRFEVGDTGTKEVSL